MPDMNIERMAELIRQKNTAESPNFAAYYEGRLHEFMDQNAVTDEDLAEADQLSRKGASAGMER